MTTPVRTAPATAAAPTPTKAPTSSYVVKAGDTLSRIAQSKLGDQALWKEIAALNKATLKDPNKITPGMQLQMPPLKTVVVKQGDTLAALAGTHLGDATKWRDIARYNKDVCPDPNRILPGMKLRVPDVPPARPATPQPPADGFGPSAPLQGIFWGDKFAPKEVALTFDDGPHPVYTPKVLDLLKQFGAKATFFVTGENAEKHPELVRRIVDEGHTLGAHSWDHDDQRTLDAIGVRQDFDRTQAAVDQALGRRYELKQFRPPYGARDAEVDAEVKRRGAQMVMWNVDSNDWRYKDDDQKILQHIFEGTDSVYAKGGAILFHDIQPQTVSVLDDVLARLKREGFKIEKTDQLLAEKYSLV